MPASALQHPASSSDSQKVQHVQAGLWWPAADAGKLREAAQAWRSLASDLESIEAAADGVVRGVRAQNHGQGTDAFASYWESRWVGGNGALPHTTAAARAMADALERYAVAVEKAKRRVEELVAAAATAVVLGVALTILTVGISDVVAGATAAGLVAAAAAVGIELSAEVAGIVGAGLLVTAAGALDGGLTDLVIQGERVQIFHDQPSIHWGEVLQSTEFGAATAAATFGVGTAVEASAPALGRIATRLGLTGLPADEQLPLNTVTLELQAGAQPQGGVPWLAEASNVTLGGVPVQSLEGSCVSACGEILTGGQVSEAKFLEQLGEWSNPRALADALNAREGSVIWHGGYLTEADALTVAKQGEMAAVLQAPGMPAHLVVIEPGQAGTFLVKDPGIGGTYEVTAEWIMKYVAGAVWR